MRNTCGINHADARHRPAINVCGMPIAKSLATEWRCTRSRGLQPTVLIAQSPRRVATIEHDSHPRSFHTFNRRSATASRSARYYRGLKSTATSLTSLRDFSSAWILRRRTALTLFATEWRCARSRGLQPTVLIGRWPRRVATIERTILNQRYWTVINRRSATLLGRWTSIKTHVLLNLWPTPTPAFITT